MFREYKQRYRGSGVSSHKIISSDVFPLSKANQTIKHVETQTDRDISQSIGNKEKREINASVSADAGPDAQPLRFPPVGQIIRKNPESDDDTTSVSSKTSVSSVFQVSRDEGLSRVRATVTSLKSRDAYLNEDTVHELTFLLSCVPDLNTSGGYDKRARRYVDEMVTCGIMDVIMQITRTHWQDAMTSHSYHDLSVRVVSTCLEVVMNALSLSSSMRYAARDAQLYKDLLRLLDHPRMRPEDNQFYWRLDTISGIFAFICLISLLVLLQELSMHAEFRPLDAVRIFSLYRKCLHENLRYVAELCFAGVVMETEKELMLVSIDTLNYFMTLLEKNMNKVSAPLYETHRILGAINQFTISDKNKVQIAEHGILRYYVKLLDPHNATDQELVAATKGIYLLAFRAKEQLTNEPGCMQWLQRLVYGSTNNTVRDQARRALWLLNSSAETTNNSIVTHKSNAQLYRRCTMDTIPVEEGHVVISHDTHNLDTLRRIVQQVQKAGLSVRLIDEETGPDFDKVTEVIDKACCVLVCMSQHYKDNPNCRLECEYAHRNKKTIIPLLLQRRYDADGWLGIIKGTKLHFDFSLEERFVGSAEGLLREIKRLAKPVYIETTHGNKLQITEQHESSDEEQESDQDNISLSSNGSTDSIFTNTTDQGLERIRNAVKHLQETEDFTNEKSMENLQFLKTASFHMDKSNKRIRRVHKYLDEMAKLGIMDVLQKIIHKSFEEILKLDFDDVEDEGENLVDDLGGSLIMLTFGLIDNGVSLSEALCKEAVRTEFYADMLRILDTQVLRPSPSNKYRDISHWIDEKHIGKEIVVAYIISSLLFIMQLCEVKDLFRKSEAVRIFDMYRKCGDDMISKIAGLGFAYVVTEQEKDMMIVGEDDLSAFKDMVEDGMDRKGEKYRHSIDMMQSPENIIDALNQLAINDDNKVQIAEQGLLPIYVQLLNPEEWGEKELKVATKGLYLLAFKVKDKLEAEPGCIEGLTNLAEKSPNKQVRDQAKGALWIINGNMSDTTKSRPKTAGLTRPSFEKGFVMISYQWDTKPTMIQVRDALRAAGHTVWMDIDNMSGSLLDSMAKAVEEAFCIVVAVTRRYKESPNCRLECEYAAKCKKLLVPLSLQAGYEPDGWLGIITGVQHNMDFSTDTLFNKSMPTLIKQINDISEGKELVPVQALNAWTPEAIHAWLAEVGLKEHMDKLKTLKGNSLEEYTDVLKKGLSNLKT